MPFGAAPSEEEKGSPVMRLFARNLDALLDWAAGVPRYKDRAPLPEMLANYIADQNWKEGAVSKRQIYRYLNSEQAASIDALALIARAFDMEAWELLVPEFHVGVRHFVLTAYEKQLFEDMKANARRLIINEGRQQADRSRTSSMGTDSEDSAPSASTVGQRSQSGRTPARKRKAPKKTKANH